MRPASWSFRAAAPTVVFLLLAAALPARAALLQRTVAGVDLYYDDVLDITWHGNANLAATETFGVVGIDPTGVMQWGTADAWIDAMNAANYLGFSDWRLPTVSPVDGVAFQYTASAAGTTDVGYNISAPLTPYAGSTASEFSYLYHNTLGNLSWCWRFSTSCIPQAGGGLTNTGPFTNFLPRDYWTGTPWFNPDLHFVFRMALTGFFPGNQGASFNLNFRSAWAVRDGDTPVVPLPAGVWLFGSAVLALAGLRRSAGTSPG
jgi:hypothetical protein